METQLPQERGTTSPLNFRPMTIVAKRLRAAFVREVGLGPGDIVLDEDPAPPLQKGSQPPPNFRLVFVVAKRLVG